PEVGGRLHSRLVGFGAYANHPTNYAKMPKTIRVLAFAKVQLLDVTGPLQVFASANDIAGQKGLPPPYAPTVIASGGGAVMSSAGLALLAEPLPDGDSDTLVIAGGWGVYAAAEDASLV